MKDDMQQERKHLFGGRKRAEDAELSEELATAEDVQRALEDWKAAENFLNEARDPALIEYAIYDVEAARRKYTYMLSKYRQAND